MISLKRKEDEGILPTFKRHKNEESLAAEKENFYRICAIKTYIVGIRHYGGKNSVRTGSKIWFKRNPENKDPNTIECWPKPTSCTLKQIVGHICKELAVPLARLLDDNLVSVEGKIIFDVEALRVANYVKPILITLSANVTRKDEIIRMLQEYQYYDVHSHDKTAPMKKGSVDFQQKYMAYEIEEIVSNEEVKLDLQQMELRHLLVLFALLLTDNNQFCLENNDWVKHLNRVNKDFDLPEKTGDILRQRLRSEKLKKYIVEKDRNIVFKSTNVLGITMQFFSEKENYIEYFVQNATDQGLYQCCMTSSQTFPRPAIILNDDHLRILIKRLNYNILFHPVIKDNSIHKMVCKYHFVQNWFRSIHTFAPSAPVILVATHAEGKSFREIQQFFVDVWNVPNVQRLKMHLDESRKFWITLRDDDNITELKDCIANQSKALASWGKQIPKKWALCENFLKDTKKKRKIITLQGLLDLIKRKLGYLQMSKDELMWMLTFFHEIGDIIYFDEEDLEKFVILDVDFLLDIFKCIIRTDLNVRGKIARQYGNRWTVYEQKGLLGEEMCIEMLKELHDLRTEDRNAIFQYLTHIGIMIDISEPDLGEKLWYIPSMNKSLFPFEAYESYMRSPVHCFVADFLPDIIYYRLISKAITSHSIGEVLLDGNEKCMYQSVCAFLYDETYIVLIGRCETSLQVQILATIELDKSVCSALLGKVSHIINDVASTFHLNIEFSEGLLCDQSQITDHFRTSGMLMCDIQQACEKKSTFLCKTCPISRRHLINSKEWLSFRMGADEPMEEDEEKEDLVKEKRDIYLLFDFVATNIKTIFEARSLCFELLGDEFVLENDKKHNPRRVLFDALVTWIERNPSIEHLEILTRALQKISRCDIVQKIHCIKHTDYTEHYVPHPDLNIKQSDIKAVVKDAAVNYHEIGLFLGLSPQKLKQIELDYPSDVRGKMHQVLSQLPVSRQMIINSLKYVERIDLIAKLTARWN